MTNHIRTDDPQAMMEAVGDLVPALARESIDHGFYTHTVSRRLDPVGFARYTDTTRANMLYDHIADAARGLIMSAGSDGLSWQISGNKRATEIMLDPFFAFRIKRAKRKRGGMTATYPTPRQGRIDSPPPYLGHGQAVIDFKGWGQGLDDEDRVWTTIAFDLDDTEEAVARVAIGIKLCRRWLWKVALPPADADVVARVAPSAAEYIHELRRLRSA